MLPVKNSGGAQKLKDEVIQLANELGLELLARSDNDTQQDLVLINSQLLREHAIKVKFAMMLTKWLGPVSSRLLEKV